MKDTIAAIATSLGPAGLGVIRISGEKAFCVADELVQTVKNIPVSQMQPYTCAYGKIVHKDFIVDEVVVTVFREPHSYTGENVAELAIHGSIPLLQHTLRLCLEAGARLADPGEFTKRAYLNGKMDLSQAEAVANMISAGSLHAAKAARAVKEGRLSRRIAEIRSVLLEQAANAAAWVDFPDEDTDSMDVSEMLHNLHSCRTALIALCKGFFVGNALQQGLRTAIIGKPNVGKSTLMNLLCGQNRSIVSSTAGTTRDVVTEIVQMSAVTLRLADTAGIHQNTKDDIESIGIHRAMDEAETADLILLVLDSSQPLTREDHELITRLPKNNLLIILNKSDLPQAFDSENLSSNCVEMVAMSAKQGEGFQALDNAISRFFSDFTHHADDVYLASLRQYTCAQATLEAVEEAIHVLEQQFTWDVVGVCLEEALSQLMMLTGEHVSIAIVEEVFSKFCVGK